jgi:hypothetical protein
MSSAHALLYVHAVIGVALLSLMGRALTLILSRRERKKIPFIVLIEPPFSRATGLQG